MDVMKAQYEARAKDLEVAKAIVETAAAEDRAMSADEQVTFERANEEFSRRTTMIDELKRMASAEQEVRAAQAAHQDEIRPMETAKPASNDADTIRSVARGEIRSANFEKRDVTTGSTGAPVPTSFYDQVILLARATLARCSSVSEPNSRYRRW
jgi:HK97 family phage major capsid protein